MKGKLKAALTAIVIIVISCAVSYGGMYLVSKVNPYKTPTPYVSSISPSESAWTACTLFVQKQLRIDPSTAQRYYPGGVVQKGSTFTVTVFYATIPAAYVCNINHLSSGNWSLQDLRQK